MQSSRKGLIRAALLERLGQLRVERIATLRARDFGAYAPLVSELQARINASSPESSVAEYHQPTTDAGGWTEWEGDCLEALRRLALGEALTTRLSVPLPVEPFLASLHEVRRRPHERFRLLAERYACPLNILLDGERDVREHLLERLMVQERAHVESRRADGVLMDDVLLKLNLLAVYAAQAEDLRYLDALNYYYEFHERLNPAGTHKWLVASYLGLYAGALIAWLNQKL